MQENTHELVAYLEMIERTLKTKKERNPYYSQRAFARDLGINQSDLSQILKLKKPMSKNIAVKILQTLNWSEEEKNQFIQSYLWHWWNQR